MNKFLVLIAGLGNPGRKYRYNRHNLGFMVVDRLAIAHGIKINSAQNQALVGYGRIAHKTILMAKPQTQMNHSGAAVGALASTYKIATCNILIIYDELDLPFGTIRLREKGGPGGHNGMKSIINHLGQSFPRLRLGIGRPPDHVPTADYLLQDFQKDDRVLLDEVCDAAVCAIESFLTDGIQLAMSKYNGAKEK